MRRMPFTSPITREPTRWNLPEREALSNWLDYHRATAVHKLDGLDAEQVRRPMVPSGTSLLGLVKHLTEVEHGWFVIRIGQIDEPWLYAREGDMDADFRIEADETTDSVVAEYLRMCDRSREILAGVESLDQTVPHPRRGPLDVRWIVLHMIEETARHNGHADIIREQIDGAVEHLNP
jgi:uncharacterized damage-inducible protein DinB